MENMGTATGGFTIPGEAGREDLTLALAKRWGADAVRDSDGTVLSERILAAGLDVYSTLCLVRADNAWAKANPDKLQQNYLMSFPVVAEGSCVQIDPLKGYFKEQFKLNERDDPKEWWQVFDRTAGTEVPPGRWDYDAARGVVTVRDTARWHSYTVNFLAYTIWEAISMYNHITNDWGGREHLMPVDPIYPETREFILAYLRRWLLEHPRTRVVRFTSLFYNFAWFWGDGVNQRYVYFDWGGYDHTVSPYAIRLFAEARGYRPVSEDFVNGGAFCSSHNVPSRVYREWMDFIHEFVTSFGRECVDLVHAAGKEAYIFYDDHWIGAEPYGPRFPQLGMDGLIKCVFNAFEARLCAEAEGVKTKELRLHPYLFPVGLKGEPTFKEGGDPAGDARRFWTDVRRALLRAPVDRIGLGGYLHLVEDYPDFTAAIEEIAREFRLIKDLHRDGPPWKAPFKIAVLTAWGRLRSWICNGHFIRGLDLNELLESLAGLPFEVEFLGFEEIRTSGIPGDVGVLLNCGRAGSAWSGGEHWRDPEVLTRISGWVAGGGGFIGIGEPSACENGGRFFQLAGLLGVDREIGRTLSKDKVAFAVEDRHFILADPHAEPDFGRDADGVFILDRDTQVLAAKDGSPRLACRVFGKGRSIYLSGFSYAPGNTRLLHRSLYWAAGREADFGPWICDNPRSECAWFPTSRRLAVINHGPCEERTAIRDEADSCHELSLKPYELKVIAL